MRTSEGDTARPQHEAEGRVAVLDGLRALAITLVMVFHFTDIYREKFPSSSVPLATFFMNGWCGVNLFFVLSGFLITRQLLAGDTLLYFYKKRFMRIAPAYYVTLTLLTFTLFPPFPHSDPTHLWWRYGYHLCFLQDIFMPDILPVFWSIAIEFHFYLVAPFLIGALARTARPWRYAVLILTMGILAAIKVWGALYLVPPGSASAIYAWHMRHYLPFQLDGLIVGVVGAFFWSDEAIRRCLAQARFANALFGMGILLVILLTNVDIHFKSPVTFFEETALDSLLSIAFGGMMLGLLGGCAGHKVFMLRPLRFIALISYSLYLVHVVIATAVFHGLFSSHHAILETWLVLLVLYFFLSIAMSFVSYSVIEKPCIEWSKKGGHRRARKNTS